MNQTTEDVVVRVGQGPGPGEGEYTSTFVRVKITGEPYAVSQVKELINHLNINSSKYVVWETEYPEEGSVMYDASSAEEAKQKYSEDTGVPQSVTELDACKATPDIIAAHLALE